MAASGESACPRDRCCLDPEPLQTEGRSHSLTAKTEEPKTKTKNHGSGSPMNPSVWPGKGPQDEQIPQSITFLRLAACLPRWILATKTKFGAFLAKTFHLQCRGSAPSTVVFPLPLADFGIFHGGAPRMSHRRWLTLVRKRLLHLVIVALNYLHDGFRGGDVALLGRRPNPNQRAMHRRLWSLIAACDTPGEVPLSPGRSGKEFIARLHILEEFAKTCPVVCEGFYGEGPRDLEQHVSFLDGKKFGASPVDVAEGHDDLAAYRPLDVDRLKLTGEGRWDLSKHLHDELWLPFVEPKILRHGQPVDFSEGPNFALESEAENLRLAKLWSTKGLLELSVAGASGGLASRVFNNFKNKDADRMIGDRRLMNAGERHICGPSKMLPAGYMITSIHCPRGSVLRGIVTDRKDFYHQARVTRARAESNALPFSFDAGSFKDDEAFDRLRCHLDGLSGPRHLVGDMYGKPKAKKRRGVLLTEDTKVFPCFASLFQGDHLGVEFALSSHCSLLADYGLLKIENKIRNHAAFPLGPVWEGLVIDDYFAISCQPSSDSSRPQCLDFLDIATGAYKDDGVLGSPEKDVIGSRHFAVVGAEVDCSKAAISRGTVLVGSSVAKRLSIVALSLRLAQLPVISRGLASRLSGTWTSTLMFRRCLVSILDGIYRLGVIDGCRDDEVLKLPRSAAEELVLASILSFVAGSNVQVPYSDRIFATDASMRKGAVTSRSVGSSTAQVVWLGGDKRGAYTRLDNPFRAALRGLGCEVDEPTDSYGHPLEGSFAAQRRDAKLDFSFDFCEICGGSGVVSEAATKLGLTVMPPIELSDSPHFDLGSPRLLEWLCFMLQKGRIRSIMCEPPCTTFSPAAHPAVRSYSQPLGFNRSCKKTWLGNLLAFRCFFLMLVAKHYNRPSLLEQPFLSKMAWLSIWRHLRKQGFSESAIASCMFGSPHLKKFRLLSFGLPCDGLSVACSGDHHHVRIEGSFTKASAVYVPKLAHRFASVFAAALERINLEEEEVVGSPCIESAVLNDLLMTGDWRVDLQWFWTSRSHINILESHAFLGLLRMLIREGGDLRFSVLLDSRVAKCAHAKGRSSSKALMPSLRKAAALQVGGGLYASFGFAPTRLNTADDPTRDTSLRESSSLSCLAGLSVDINQRIHSSQLSRPTAGWVRLCLLLGCIPSCEASWPFHGPSDHFYAQPNLCGFCSGTLIFGAALCFLAVLWILPCCSHLRLSCSFSLSCCSDSFGLLPNISAEPGSPKKPQKTGSPKGFRGKQSIIHSRCLLGCLLFHVSDAMFQSGSTADQARAERRSGTQLFTDRVLKPQTRNRRDVLLQNFDVWTQAHYSESIILILEGGSVDAERVANLLVGYGRSLYYAGRPYGVYSETINAVTSKRGSLRRMLGLAWDLAFSWVADEPASHHPALPRSVLLAITALAMLWTWTVEAGIFLLCWCGILRIGEVLGARRRDLILPSDGAPGVFFALSIEDYYPEDEGSCSEAPKCTCRPK